MNKKLLIFGIVGWGYAVLVVMDNLRIVKEFTARLNAQSDLIEEATKIVTEIRFQEIIENEGLN